MICGSICSGVSADSVAWHPLGWRHAFYAEIDKFCCAVLKHHYPDVPNYGDFTKRSEFDAIDVLMVSTPCQDFSVAGRREGMGGARGSLTLAALGVVEKTRPRWLVFENVPGLLQADCAIGFREFLSRLAKLGYGFAYRVLDAQFAGLAQRRERVFLVAHLGDWRPAAAVFLDSFSVQGHPAPRRETGEGFTHDVAPSLTSSGRGVERSGESRRQDPVVAVGPLMANTHPGSYSGQDAYTGHIIAHALRADGFDASEDGAGRGTPLVPVDVTPIDMRQASRGEKMTNNRREGSTGGAPGTGIGAPGDPCPTLADSHTPAIAFFCKDHGADAGEIAPTLRAMGHEGSHANAGGQVAVAFQESQTGTREYDTAGTVRANGPGHDPVGTRIRSGMAVRRLTPRECERLMGYEDDYTLIPEYRKVQKERGADAESLYAYYCRTERGRLYTEMRDGRVYSTPDGPRYKALGNSIAVPCLRWIGERIEMVESILLEAAA